MKEIPIVLLGFGNVGQSMARLLSDHDGFASEGVRLRLSAAFDRGGGVDVSGRRVDELLEAKWRGQTVSALAGAREVALADVLDGEAGTILVDGSITDAKTGEPGYSPARRALDSGCSVVFASKGPLVARYQELSDLARARGASLGMSAAVGIPLPSLEVGVLGLRGASLTRFRAVLNDTANQILRDVETGRSLDEAVESARLEGTIEEDPSLDLDGWDATYKLLILARAFWDPSLSLDSVSTTGVGAVGARELRSARAENRRIRLVSTAERDGDGELALRTEPALLAPDDPLYALGPGEKGAVFETDVMGTISMKSTKGGPMATAASVVKDVLNIAWPRLR